MVGKADIFKLDGVVRWELLRPLRALHILKGKDVRHLADDGRHLRDIIGVGKSGDERLHDAEGQDNDRQKGIGRERAVHMKDAAHRQNAQQR